MRGKAPTAALAALVGLGLMVAPGVGAGAHAAPRGHRVARARPAGKSPWLQSNPAKRTAQLLLKAGVGSVNGGENFDGYARGAMVVRVPVGWTLTIVFKNVGGLPHSFVVEPWGESLSSSSPKPAFPGAESPNPLVGTPPGSGVTVHVRLTKLGKYRILCAVPGHAPLGMWDVLMVVKAKTASIQV